MFDRLICFLQLDLEIPADSVALAIKTGEREPDRFAVILWQYGLLTIEQLEKVFNWIESF